MDYYTLKATRSRVLGALQDLAESVRGLRALAEAGKLNSPESDALGTRWEEQRDAFENFVIRPLPRHVREKLCAGEDSVTRARVLRFQPRDPTVVEQLEPYMRSAIEAASGWLRRTTWGVYGPPQSRVFTIKALLQNPDWTPDWTGVDVAIDWAEQVFREYKQQDRTDLEPNETDIEALIRETVAAHQPEWMPSGKGFEASQFALIHEAGTLQIPFILEVHALRREILSREEPCQVEHLVDRVLDRLQRSGVLKLFSYRPIDEPKKCSYYYLAEGGTLTTANGAASGAESARDQDVRATGNLTANIFRRRVDFWEVRFQGEPARPALVVNSVGMEHLHQLLLNPWKSIPAIDLVTIKKPTSAPRTVGPEHAEFAEGAQGDTFIDQEALRAYKDECIWLEKEYATAERENDEAAKGRIRKRQVFILKEVGLAEGPDGKLRKQVDPATNRARKTVAQTLDNAIEKLREHVPKLAAHLGSYIRHGITCSYCPREDAAWDL